MISAAIACFAAFIKGDLDAQVVHNVAVAHTVVIAITLVLSYLS